MNIPLAGIMLMQACLILHTRGFPEAESSSTERKSGKSCPGKVNTRRILQGEFISREEFLPHFLLWLVMAIFNKQGWTCVSITNYAKGRKESRELLTVSSRSQLSTSHVIAEIWQGSWGQYQWVNASMSGGPKKVTLGLRVKDWKSMVATFVQIFICYL